MRRIAIVDKMITLMRQNSMNVLLNTHILAKLLLLCIISTSTVFAQEALTESQQKGLEIAKLIKASNTGWVSSSSNMVMILRNKKGRELQRLMSNRALEVADDGDKALTVFNTPADVRGTAFLSFSHIHDSDDQWIYLPALKRVKRIASRNKSGPFLGSEFAFEDLSSFEVEKNTYDYLGDDSINDLDTYKIEMRPLDKYSGYTRTVAWVDKAHYRIHKIDFYDRRDTLLKTLTQDEFKLHLDRFWRADKQYMINHKTGKSTDLHINDLSFGVDVDESVFNENRLRNAR